MNANALLKKAKTFVLSKHFLFVLVGIIFLQGIWYAANFEPSILDEGRHVGFIQLYTETANPFIDEQNPSWDSLGEVTRDPSYFYYYLMSWPLRLAELVTDSFQAQVFFLRFINIAFFAAAIIVYDKFFRRMGISTVLTRIVLLLLIITPAIAVLPGAVSYDNLSLLMSAAFLYVGAGMLKSKKFDYKQLSILVIIIGVGAVIKYTFLALAVPATLYLLFDAIRSKKLRIPKLQLDKSVVVLGALTLLSVGLFIERPVYNLIKHGDITPSCAELIGEERCLKNYVQERNITALENRDGKELKSAYEYTVVDWVPNMIRSQVRLNPWDAPAPVMFALYSLALYGGIIMVLLYLRDMLQRRHLAFIIVATVVYTLILFATNYASYKNLGEVVATSSRYLLPVQPLFMVLVAIAVRSFFGKYKKLLAVCLLATLVLFATGGSVITYARTADPGVRWSD